MTGHLFFCSVVLFCVIGSVQCIGYVETNFKEFVNFEGKRFDGKCCDKSGFWSWGASKDKCTDECDHSFVICMGNATQSSSMSACEFGQQELDDVGGNKISFNSHVGTAVNPIKFQFGTWPGIVKLKIDVHDKDGDSEFDFVDHYEYQYNTRDLRREIDAPKESLVLTGTRTRFNMDLKVYCDIHYYGQDCNTYCIETDDDTGHFRCDPVNGDKICKSGWKGNDCLTNIDDCVGNRCSYGSTCVDGLNFYSCLCPPGRTGFTCEAEINECASVPCQNGGKCLDASNGFICECLPGFAGPLCEVEIDECRSGPCLNGGACVDKKAAFACICQLGFTGDRCEIDNDECTSNPCIRAERCVDLPGDYRCDCFPGFTGKNCEYNINECISSPCKNGGWCIDEVSSFLCICQFGFTGSLCEARVNYCEPNYCQNGATCSSLETTFECHCTPQYTGIMCENDVNECETDTQLCGNNGICVNTFGNYFCDCNEGFEGKFCETETDECLSEEITCLNDGLCIDRINAYHCDCTGTGFSGSRCEEELDECESSPCENGGLCIDMLNGFVCNCSSGFAGERCEMKQVTSSTFTTSTSITTPSKVTTTESETTVSILSKTPSTSSNDTFTTLGITQSTYTSPSSATTANETFSLEPPGTSVTTFWYTYPSGLHNLTIENGTDIQNITTMGYMTEITNKTVIPEEKYMQHNITKAISVSTELQVSNMTTPQLLYDVENITAEDTLISTVTDLKVTWPTSTPVFNVTTMPLIDNQTQIAEDSFSPVDYVTLPKRHDQSTESEDATVSSGEIPANETLNETLTWEEYPFPSATKEMVSSGDLSDTKEYLSSSEPSVHLPTSEVNKTDEYLSSGEITEFLSEGELNETENFISSGETFDTEEYISSGEASDYASSGEIRKEEDYKSSGEAVEYVSSGEAIETEEYVSSGELIETEKTVSSGETVGYASSGDIAETEKYLSSGEVAEFVSSTEIIKTEEYRSSGEVSEYVSSGEVIETEEYISSGETVGYVSSGDITESKKYVSSGDVSEYVSSGEANETKEYMSSGGTVEYSSSGETIETEEYISSGESIDYVSSGEIIETEEYISSGESIDHVSSGETIKTEEYVSSGEVSKYVSSGEAIETEEYVSSGEASGDISSGELIETEEYISSGETVGYASSGEIIETEKYPSSGEAAEYVSSTEIIKTEEYRSSGDTAGYASSGDIIETKKYVSSGDVSEYISSGDAYETKEYMSSGGTVEYSSSGKIIETEEYISSGESVDHVSSGETIKTEEYVSSGEASKYVSSGEATETEEYVSSGEASGDISSGELIETEEYISSGETVGYASSGEIIETEKYSSSGEAAEYVSSTEIIKTEEYRSSGDTVEYASSEDIIESKKYVSSGDVSEYISSGDASETKEYMSSGGTVEYSSSGETIETEEYISSGESVDHVSSGETIETQEYVSSGEASKYVSSGEAIETEEYVSSGEASGDISSGELIETEEYISSRETVGYVSSGEIIETEKYPSSGEAAEYVSSTEIIKTEEYRSSGDMIGYTSSGDIIETKKYVSPNEVSEETGGIIEAEEYLSSGEARKYVSSGDTFETEDYISSGETVAYTSLEDITETEKYESSGEVSGYISSTEIIKTEEYRSSGVTVGYASSGDIIESKKYVSSGDVSEYISSGDANETKEYMSSGETVEYSSSGETTETEEHISSRETSEYVSSGEFIETKEYVSSGEVNEYVSSGETIETEEYISSGEASEYVSSGRTVGYSSSGETIETETYISSGEASKYISSGETFETEEYVSSVETVAYASSGETIETEEYISPDEASVSSGEISETEEYKSTTKAVEYVSSGETEEYISSGKVSEYVSSGETIETKQYISSGETIRYASSGDITETEKYMSSGESVEHISSTKIIDPEGHILAETEPSSITQEGIDLSTKYGSVGGLTSAATTEPFFMKSTSGSPVTDGQSVIWTSSDGQVTGDSDAKLINYTEYNIVSSGDGQFIEYILEEHDGFKQNFTTGTTENVTIETEYTTGQPATKPIHKDFSEAHQIDHVFSGSGDDEYKLDLFTIESESGQNILTSSTREATRTSPDEQYTVQQESVSETEPTTNERITSKLDEVETVKKNESSISFFSTSSSFRTPYTTTEIENGTTSTQAEEETVKSSTKTILFPVIDQNNLTSYNPEIIENTTFPQSSTRDITEAALSTSSSSLQTIRLSEQTEKTKLIHEITKPTSATSEINIITTTSTVTSTKRPDKPVRPWLVARKHLHTPSTTTLRTTKIMKEEPLNPWLAARRYLGRKRPKPRRKTSKVPAVRKTTKTEIRKLVTSTVKNNITQPTAFDKETLLPAHTSEYEVSTPVQEKTMVVDEATEHSTAVSTSDKVQYPAITRKNVSVSQTLAFTRMPNVSKVTEFLIQEATYHDQDILNMTEQTRRGQNVSEPYGKSSTLTGIQKDVSATKQPLDFATYEYLSKKHTNVTEQYSGSPSTFQFSAVASEVVSEAHITQKMSTGSSKSVSLNDTSSAPTVVYSVPPTDEHITKNATFTSAPEPAAKYTTDFIFLKDMNVSTSEYPFKSTINGTTLTYVSSAVDSTTVEDSPVSTDVPLSETNHTSTLGEFTTIITKQVIEDRDLYTTDQVTFKVAEQSTVLAPAIDIFTNITTKSLDASDSKNKTIHVATSASVLDKSVSVNTTSTTKLFKDLFSSTTSELLSNYSTGIIKPTTHGYDEVYNHTIRLADQTEDTTTYEGKVFQTDTISRPTETVKPLPTSIPCFVKEKCGPLPTIPKLPDLFEELILTTERTDELTTACKSGYCKNETKDTEVHTSSIHSTGMTNQTQLPYSSLLPKQVETSTKVHALDSTNSTESTHFSEVFVQTPSQGNDSEVEVPISSTLTIVEKSLSPSTISSSLSTVTETSVKLENVSQEQPSSITKGQTTVQKMAVTKNPTSYLTSSASVEKRQTTVSHTHTLPFQLSSVTPFETTEMSHTKLSKTKTNKMEKEVTAISALSTESTHVSGTLDDRIMSSTIVSSDVLPTEQTDQSTALEDRKDTKHSSTPTKELYATTFMSIPPLASNRTSKDIESTSSRPSIILTDKSVYKSTTAKVEDATSESQSQSSKTTSNKTDVTDKPDGGVTQRFETTVPIVLTSSGTERKSVLLNVSTESFLSSHISLVQSVGDTHVRQTDVTTGRSLDLETKNDTSGTQSLQSVSTSTTLQVQTYSGSTEKDYKTETDKHTIRHETTVKSVSGSENLTDSTILYQKTRTDVPFISKIKNRTMASMKEDTESTQVPDTTIIPSTILLTSPSVSATTGKEHMSKMSEQENRTQPFSSKTPFHKTTKIIEKRPETTLLSLSTSSRTLDDKNMSSITTLDVLSTETTKPEDIKDTTYSSTLMDDGQLSATTILPITPLASHRISTDIEATTPRPSVLLTDKAVYNYTTAQVEETTSDSQIPSSTTTSNKTDVTDKADDGVTQRFETTVPTVFTRSSSERKSDLLKNVSTESFVSSNIPFVQSVTDTILSPKIRTDVSFISKIKNKTISSMKEDIASTEVPAATVIPSDTKLESETTKDDTFYQTTVSSLVSSIPSQPLETTLLPSEVKGKDGYKYTIEPIEEMFDEEELIWLDLLDTFIETITTMITTAFAYDITSDKQTVFTHRTSTVPTLDTPSVTYSMVDIIKKSDLTTLSMKTETEEIQTVDIHTTIQPSITVETDFKDLTTQDFGIISVEGKKESSQPATEKNVTDDTKLESETTRDNIFYRTTLSSLVSSIFSQPIETTVLPSEVKGKDKYKYTIEPIEEIFDEEELIWVDWLAKFIETTTTMIHVRQTDTTIGGTFDLETENVTSGMQSIQSVSSPTSTTLNVPIYSGSTDNGNKTVTDQRSIRYETTVTSFTESDQLTDSTILSPKTRTDVPFIFEIKNKTIPPMKEDTASTEVPAATVIPSTQFYETTQIGSTEITEKGPKTTLLSSSTSTVPTADTPSVTYFTADLSKKSDSTTLSMKTETEEIQTVDIHRTTIQPSITVETDFKDLSTQDFGIISAEGKKESSQPATEKYATDDTKLESEATKDDTFYQTTLSSLVSSIPSLPLETTLLPSEVKGKDKYKYTIEPIQEMFDEEELIWLDWLDTFIETTTTMITTAFADDITSDKQTVFTQQDDANVTYRSNKTTPPVNISYTTEQVQSHLNESTSHQEEVPTYTPAMIGDSLQKEITKEQLVETPETTSVQQKIEIETSSVGLLVSGSTSFKTDGQTSEISETLDKITTVPVQSSSSSSASTETTTEKPYIRLATILTYVSKGDNKTEDVIYGQETTDATVASSASPSTKQLSKIRHEVDLTAKNTYPNPKKETFEYIRNTNVTRGKAKLTFKAIKVTVIKRYQEGKRIVLQTYQKVKNIATTVVVTTYRRSRELLEHALQRVEALWEYCKTGIDHYIVKPLLNARVLVKSKFEQTYARLNEIFSRGQEILKMTRENVREEASTYFDSLAQYYTDVYRQYSTEVRDIFESLKIPDS